MFVSYSKSAVRGYRATACLFNEEAGKSLKVNFTLPAAPICVGQDAFSVRVPSVDGEFAIQYGMAPRIAQLKPGVVRVTAERGADPDQYFVSGGYCVVHASGVADISAVEAYKLEDLDVAEAEKLLQDVQGKIGAASGEEKAVLQVELSLYNAVIRAGK